MIILSLELQLFSRPLTNSENDIEALEFYLILSDIYVLYNIHLSHAHSLHSIFIFIHCYTVAFNK